MVAMAVAGHEQLAGKLTRQLDLFREIYQATVSLAVICSSDPIDQEELDLLLARRQEMIEATMESQRACNTLAQQAGIKVETTFMRDILFEIRSVLEKTAFLDQAARNDLQKKRDQLKNQLQQVQTGKKAGAAYRAVTYQEEGTFLDSKKN